LICGCREARDSPLRGERNDRKLAPIVCLAAQGHPAIAEEPIRLGAGVAAHVLDDAQAESLQPTGAQSLRLAAGVAGKAVESFTGKGASLALPNPAGLSGPIDVQLRRSGGADLCWGAHFSAPFQKDADGQLKDTSD